MQPPHYTESQTFHAPMAIAFSCSFSIGNMKALTNRKYTSSPVYKAVALDCHVFRGSIVKCGEIQEKKVCCSCRKIKGQPTTFHPSRSLRRTNYTSGHRYLGFPKDLTLDMMMSLIPSCLVAIRGLPTFRMVGRILHYPSLPAILRFQISV